jgi:hypothetical protein
MPYSVVKLSYSPNTLYPDLGCAWFGIVGHIHDKDGFPKKGVTVRVCWAGCEHPNEMTTAVSDSTGFYERFLDNKPRKETWYVQLFEGGVAASEVYTVQSVDNCASIVIWLDWKRNY